MERVLGLYRSLEDAYADWAQKWGVALSQAVTHTADASEQALAEGIVAVLASSAEVAVENRAVQFAQCIYRQAVKRAASGYTTDEFFKLPYTVRACVALKIKARFSRAQIALALDITPQAVDLNLEKARLAFTRGKPWLVNGSFRRQLDDAKLVAPCPDPQDGRLFARYLENDMSSDDTLALHKHLVGCTACRSNLLHFKNTYNDWLFTLPEPEVTKATAHYIKKTVAQGKRARESNRRKALPSPLPGFKQIFRDRQTVLLLAAIVAFMILYSMRS